jgi:hypothetical protein
MDSCSSTNRLGMSRAILLTFMLTCLAACGTSTDKQDGDSDIKHGDANRNDKLLSAHWLLAAADYEKFRPGRSKDDILRDVQWRGNFQVGCEFKGGSLCAIGYGIRGGPMSSTGEGVWAIFADEKFLRFVPWPIEGPKTTTVGDFSLVLRAVETKPLDILDLDKEIASRSNAPKQIDPGLTIASLLLLPGVQAAQARTVARNARLRDQFNASRLRIGMTESAVEVVLKAKPIESGQVKAGVFKVYGSTETFEFAAGLHYSNILTLFRDGKLTGIYSGSFAHGGDEGLRDLRAYFVDLPPLHKGGSVLRP